MYPTILLPSVEQVIHRPARAGTVFWVDSENGSDENEGVNPDSAKATIQAAITASNALVDWSPNSDVFNYIMVMPGNPYAENLTPAYWAYIVGLGMRGTDTAAEIHPTTGNALAGTLLGSGLINLHFEVDAQDAICINGGIVNNSWIEHCLFTIGASVTGCKGIVSTNCSHLTVRKCDFESGQASNDLAYPIYANEGYFHSCRIEKNNIFAQTAGVYLGQNVTPSKTIFKKNVIRVKTTGKGIDVNGGGADSPSDMSHDVLAVKNYIIIYGAGDALHGFSANQMLHNETNVNGSFAYETA